MDLAVDTEAKLLMFLPRDDKSKRFLPPEVYALPKPYAIVKAAWLPHLTILRKWTREDWIKNWCAIPLIEYCPREYAMESFATLGIAIASGVFGADLDASYEEVTSLLSKEFRLSQYYPRRTEDIVKCPLCRGYIKDYPAGLSKRERPNIWKPEWQKVKRAEGEDESIQLMHVHPLVESGIYHNASNVRYGHRWCNVAMTDHSIDQTIEWMIKVVERHT